MTHLIDREEFETWIVVYEVIKPPGPKAVAGDNTVAMTRLAATGHHTCLDQVHKSVGDDIAVDAEITPILQITQRLIWDAPQSDLQRRTIVNDRGDIASDTLRNVADRRMNILCNRFIDLHQRIKAVEMHKALAVGARHCWIDLCDRPPRDAQDCWCEIHGYAEADKAPSVWRRNLE